MPPLKLSNFRAVFLLLNNFKGETGCCGLLDEVVNVHRAHLDAKDAAKASEKIDKSTSTRLTAAIFLSLVQD